MSSVCRCSGAARGRRRDGSCAVWRAIGWPDRGGWAELAGGLGTCCDPAGRGDLSNLSIRASGSTTYRAAVSDRLVWYSASVSPRGGVAELTPPRQLRAVPRCCLRGLAPPATTHTRSRLAAYFSLSLGALPRTTLTDLHPILGTDGLPDSRPNSAPHLHTRRHRDLVRDSAQLGE